MTIIIHHLKLIFIRCRKTASTAIEIELSKIAQGGDIITPISPRDEEIRAAVGGRPPQNFINADQEYARHMSATDVIGRIGKKKWSKYFSFCIDRNPWDKVASMYFHRRGRRTEAGSLDEFISSGEFLDARNFDLYCQDKAPLVNFVGKYEALDESMRHVFAQIGAPYAGLTTRPKSQFRPISDNYRNHFTEKSRNHVGRAFKDEIELHKYSY